MYLLRKALFYPVQGLKTSKWTKPFSYGVEVSSITRTDYETLGGKDFMELASNILER